MLMAIRLAFSAGVTLAGAERLVMLEKISLINTLPLSYRAQIIATPGVADVTHANWFGGIYQDPKNFFANMAVDPPSWIRTHAEFVVPDDQRQAWLADRTGAMVGVETARRFGWKIGDRVPLQGTIYRRPNGGPWEFTIDAIYDSREKNADRTQFFFHHTLLNETIGKGAYGHDEVTFYLIRVSDPRQADQVASRLDTLFSNSSAETKTATEKAFVSSFAGQIGDVGTIMIAIASAVLFTILLMSGNTMAQAIRERTNELAVLKALGFGDGEIFSLVLVESCTIAATGGGLGLGLSWAAITAIGDPTHGLLPPIYLSARDTALGLGLIAALGLATGILPAVEARRLKIVDALRRG